jgi:hypothetical protein
VTFSYKDYAHGGERRSMTLSAIEFLRRFVQHILPRGFVRIRQAGFLAPRNWIGVRYRCLDGNSQLRPAVTDPALAKAKGRRSYR